MGYGGDIVVPPELAHTGVLFGGADLSTVMGVSVALIAISIAGLMTLGRIRRRRANA